MAEADILVKVGADITGFLSKIDAAQAKVNQLTEEQGRLKDVVSGLNKLLRINENELAATTVKLQKLNTTTVRGAAAARVLGKQIALLSNDSKGLRTAILGVQSNLATTTTQLKASTVALKQAQAGTSAFGSGVTKAFSGLRTLANIIPGLGISTLILLVSGPIIEAFRKWHNSINGVTEAFKLLKLNQENITDILRKGNEEAGKQLASMKILYTAATNVNLSMKDRLLAVQALQKEYPSYFSNISQETILNGGAKSAYDLLATSIIKVSRAKAAKEKLDALESKRLDNAVEQQKAIVDASKEIAQAQAKIGTGTQIIGGLGTTAASQGLTKQEVVTIIQTRRELRLGVLAEEDKLLKGQQEFLLKYIGIEDLLKAELGKPEKIPKLAKTTKALETVADILAKMRHQITVLEKGEDFFNIDKSLEKIKEVQSTVTKLFDQFKLETTDPRILELDFEFGIAERGEIRKELSKIVPKEVAIPVTLTLNKATAVFPVFAELEKQVLPEVAKLNQSMADNLKSGLNEALSGVGESIGNAIAEGGDIGKAIFGGLFKAIAGGLKELGKAMVALGTAKIALEKFHLAPGIGTVIAGIATIALGQLLQASLPKFAHGGPVDGPGNRTSDSILARLSKGEYIIKADAVSRFGTAFFDMLNSGFMPKGMATGGSVGSNSIGGGQLITVNVVGKIRNKDIYFSNIEAGRTIGRNG